MTPAEATATLAPLTELQADVLRLTLHDLKEPAIAKTLGTTPGAVKKAREEIRRKVDRGMGGCCAVAGLAGWL